MFGDVAYWLANPDIADRLRWSLAMHRWEQARLARADANLIRRLAGRRVVPRRLRR